LLRSAQLSPVAVIGAAEKYASAAGGATCIADAWPGEGPLGGIITALRASDKAGATQPNSDACTWNLIVGCDMPFLRRDWLNYIVHCATASSADVVLPESKHGLESLCACWRTTARGELQREFGRGTRRVAEAMKHLRVEVLDETHWKRFDSAGRLFWNMNRPADYDEAKRILEADCP
jgi:molybdenum cofactor guanylyltransferase